MTTDPNSAKSHQILDVVDLEDRVIGSVRRRDVFRRGSAFRVAHLFLFNERSEMLIQRLAESRDRHPDCWGSSVAAYLNKGECYRDAIVRRTREELGVSLDCVEEVGRTLMSDDKCRKFVALFTGRWTGPLTVDASHIAETRFLPVADILKARGAEPWLFTPTFSLVLDMYCDRMH